MFACIPTSLGWAMVATVAVITIIMGIAVGKCIAEAIKERREDDEEADHA